MSSRPRTRSYRAVLRTPHACRVFGAALLGRSAYGIAPLSLVLALTGATGSYAVRQAMSWRVWLRMRVAWWRVRPWSAALRGCALRSGRCIHADLTGGVPAAGAGA